MALAALAILGHRSAHSLLIGPVKAEPIKNTQITISDFKTKTDHF